jgi:hypothetical protein
MSQQSSPKNAGSHPETEIPPTTNTSPAVTVTAAASHQSPEVVMPSRPPAPDDLSEAADRMRYDYMTSHGVPALIDGLCRQLLTFMPADPVSAIVTSLEGRRHGGVQGGVAVAGHNARGGWVRCYDAIGTQTVALDGVVGLPSAPLVAAHPTPAASPGATTVGLQVVCGALDESAVYVLCSPPASASEPQGESASAGVAAPAAPGYVCKYSTVHGGLLRVYPLHRPATCLHVDRERGYVWVAFRAGNVGVFSPHGNTGSSAAAASGASAAGVAPPPAAAAITTTVMSSEVHCPPACAIHATPASTGCVWLLTARAIEKRRWDTGELQLAVHLPEAVPRLCSFAVTERHVWVAAPNPDGTAAFIGTYDCATGRALPTFITSNAGSVIAADSSLGGAWMLPRCGTATARFHSDRNGVCTASCEIGRARAFSAAADPTSRTLWIARVDFSEDSRLVQLDPFRGVPVHDIPLPACTHGTCAFIAPL